MGNSFLNSIFSSQFLRISEWPLIEVLCGLQQAMFDKKVPWFHGKTVSFSSFFALQPQNSMPDVVVWLISGTKRIASFRIPAYDVLYSPNVESCGQYCSKVFNMFMKVTIQFVVRLLVYFQRGIDRDSWILLFLIILLLWQNVWSQPSL